MLQTSIFNVFLNFSKLRKNEVYECSNYSDKWISAVWPQADGKSFIMSYFRKWIKQAQRVEKVTHRLYSSDCIFRCIK